VRSIKWVLWLSKYALRAGMDYCNPFPQVTAVLANHDGNHLESSDL
jgi:hypothetical protein